MKKKTLLIIAVLGVLLISVEAQKKIKPWTEWSEKEAQKMLNDSGWGQTQTETNTSEMFYNPTTDRGRGNSTERNAQGATNQAVNLNYRIRFLSAKPIRQAFARSILLQQKSPNAQLEEQLKAFAEQKSADWIVVAVDFDSADRRFSGPAMQVFNSANTGVLQNNTYLEIKDGKRVFLKEYRAPINDGMGAKFAFPRMVDGKLFVTPESGYVRFYSELTKDIKLNMRFKVQDMMYDGELEY
ncbi:MAG TPA: hypothetical protein VFZ34_02580 [Blastocatellia bacterium]|nr:hypothetical protein [Blastocatellia bacterium]